MKLSDALRAKRAGHLDSMTALSKLAQKENRVFTDAEATAFDDDKEAIGKLDVDIARQVAAEEHLRSEAPTAPAVLVTGRPALRDGEVRAFRHDERMHENPNPELSLGRVVRALARRDWRGAEAEQKALAEGAVGTGGAMVPVELMGSVIDAARAQAVMMRSGCLSFSMGSQQLDVARVLTDPVANWKAENADIPESGMTFDKVSFIAKALTVLVRSSVELAEDAPNFSSTVEGAIAQAIALEFDRVGLNGSGQNTQPLGVLQTPGIGSVSMGADGGELANYRPFTNAQGVVMGNNFTPNTWVHSPRTAVDLDNLVDLQGNPMGQPSLYAALPKIISTQVPTTNAVGTSGAVTSSSLTGQFNMAAYGLRTSAQIEVTRVGGEGTFQKLQLLIRCYLRADFHVLRAGAFAAVVGIKDTV